MTENVSFSSKITNFPRISCKPNKLNLTLQFLDWKWKNVIFSGSRLRIERKFSFKNCNRFWIHWIISPFMACFARCSPSICEKSLNLVSKLLNSIVCASTSIFFWQLITTDKNCSTDIRWKIVQSIVHTWAASSGRCQVVKFFFSHLNNFVSNAEHS